MHLFFEPAHQPMPTQWRMKSRVFYEVGLWALRAFHVVEAFYSLQETRTPAIDAGCGAGHRLFAVVNVAARVSALALTRASRHGERSHLAPFSIDDWAVSIGPVGRSSLLVLTACLPLVVTCLWVASAQVWSHAGEWAAKSVMLFVAIGLSVSGYAAVHALLGSEELTLLWSMVQKKIGRVAGP